MPKLLTSEKVTGPNGETVKIRFYDDQSIRFQIDDAGAMSITEAFLSPGKDKFIILKLVRRGDG